MITKNEFMSIVANLSEVKADASLNEYASAFMAREGAKIEEKRLEREAITAGIENALPQMPDMFTTSDLVKALDGKFTSGKVAHALLDFVASGKVTKQKFGRVNIYSVAK